MSFKQRLKSGVTMTRFEFSWKMIPESRSRNRKRSITPENETCRFLGKCVVPPEVQEE